MKKNKKLIKKYGKLAAEMQAYYDQLNLRYFEDLDDETFAFIMANVRGVNMLDVNETEITNESIRLLSGMEYVKDIRAKGCHKIDNGCIPDLNKITSLEFLHLKGTSITIDGLLKLSGLVHLKTLMFSADEEGVTREQLLELKNRMPQCELVVNSRPCTFRPVDLFLHEAKKQPLTYRLKIKNEALGEWSRWLTRPSENYLEAELQGPYSHADIEWIEVDSVERKQEGKLTPVKEIDHWETVVELLERLSVPYMQQGAILRIYQ